MHLDKTVLLWHREAPLFLRVYVIILRYEFFQLLSGLECLLQNLQQGNVKCVTNRGLTLNFWGEIEVKEPMGVK